MKIKLAILPALLLLAQAASAAPVYQFQQVHKGLQADGSPVVPAAPAYAFTAHTFTNCLATGALGPSEAQCRTQYANAAWTANPLNFSVSAGTGLSYSVVTPQVAPLPRYKYYLEPGAIIVTKLAP